MTASGEPPAPETELFQKLADGAPVMIWMSGRDMGCFYFNRAWLEFVGRTLAQESGNGWADGVHPDDLQRCVNHYVGCFEKRVPFAMSYRLRHHSGAYRWILDRGAPHQLPNGTFLGYFGGCAELSEENAVLRHAALGQSMLRMRAFARALAEEEEARAPGDAREESLGLSVRRLLASHEADREQIEYAARKMQQLAKDMEAYGKIPRGACLSDGR